MESKIKVATYRKFLDDNFIPVLRPLRKFISQQDNNLKNKEKATQKWFKDTKVNALEWQ